MFTQAYQTGMAWSEAFWSNEKFDEFLLQAKAELDDVKRAEMYYEMSLIARDDGDSIIPMFAPMNAGGSKAEECVVLAVLPTAKTRTAA
ncbi:hypothetical protein [Roseovarius sp. EL26]|uniref:hypothetical protein n=1 Tax=Roseovarius sp. EL26 TaxID=2126672 RepID=UPI0013C435D5|nr:hypothetical protein [Roseovarius sp. EL26]